MKKNVMCFILLIVCSIAYTQDSTTKSSLTISSYTEVYYSYDFNKPLTNTKAGFIYSHNRNNEVNLNLGFIKAAYATARVHANLALAAGTYINANYVAEPGVLKNIYEANAGIKFLNKASLWLDAGIFSSHIGFESAVGKDCWTVTRSLLAENSPYFETGAKLSYTSANNKWFLSGMVLNGWQRIQRTDGNTTPAFGTQLTFKASAGVTLNSSTFIGSNKPDSVKLMRYFHNFYGIFQLNKALGLTAGFDYGIEQRSKGNKHMNNWWSPVLIFRFTPDDKNAVAIRGEYYNDINGVIVPTGTANGFKTLGWSLNYDRQLFGHALWRIELRGLSGKDNYFIKKDLTTTGNSLFITTAIAVSF